MTLAATPRNLLGLSAILLTCAAVLGVLNGNKVKLVHESAVDAIAARQAAEHHRATQERELKAREAALAAASAKVSDMESKAAKTEAELLKVQADKTDLKRKLQANEAEVAELQRHVDEMTTHSSPNPGAPSGIELQAQLNEARAQLEAAENEKALLANKIHATTERSSQLKEDKKRPEAASGKAGVRGTVLAVNQAYNFVVLNLGERHGVETNAEMLVVRGGTLIGKIRISSVEPSTAIGDIITGSLARGVQVQPGDTVIYAGTS
jgi:hypothetical protein